MDKDELKRILEEHRQWIVTIGVYGKESHLQGADFQGLDLQGLDFRYADLEGVKNLTADQLCKAKTLYQAKLAPELEKQVKEICPILFEKPY